MNKVPVDMEKAKKYAFNMRLREVFTDGLFTQVIWNVLFFVTSLPLFTIGASMAALANCTNLHVVDDRAQFKPAKLYMASFKAAFKKTLPAGMLLLAVNIVFGSGLHFYIQMMGQNIMFVPLASLSLLALVVVWAVAIHIMPLFFESTDYDSYTVTMAQNGLKELVSKAVQITLVNMKKTVICLVIGAVIVAAQLLFMPLTIPVVLTIGLVLPAQICAFSHTEPEILED